MVQIGWHDWPSPVVVPHLYNSTNINSSKLKFIDRNLKEIIVVPRDVESLPEDGMPSRAGPSPDEPDS
jgi:hypothetical protein